VRVLSFRTDELMRDGAILRTCRAPIHAFLNPLVMLPPPKIARKITLPVVIMDNMSMLSSILLCAGLPESSIAFRQARPFLRKINVAVMIPTSQNSITALQHTSHLHRLSFHIQQLIEPVKLHSQVRVCSTPGEEGLLFKFLV
jgi:hypothetical protein